MFLRRDQYPQTIPWFIYVEVLKKIIAKKKPVYHDFIHAGAQFKLAIFFLLNNIYCEETIPGVI